MYTILLNNKNSPIAL